METTATNEIKTEGVPVSRFWDNMHIHQRKVFHAFDVDTKRFIWLNWHRRARKTTLLLNLLIRECCRNQDVTYDYVGPTYREPPTHGFSVHYSAYNPLKHNDLQAVFCVKMRITSE